MASEIIDNYKNLVARIGNLIEVAGHRNDYIAKKTGLSAAGFATKRKRSIFSIDEI